MKILSFGEILWDVYPDKAYIGGAPLNFGAHMSKLGNEVYMLSAIGNDDLGKKALKQLEDWGINTELVKVTDSKETGKCLVALDENSVPSYNLLSDVAYDYITSENVNDSFDVLYFGTLALRSDYNFDSLEKLIEKQISKEVFVDINIRAPFYSKESVQFAVDNATIIKISLEEMPTVATLLGIDEKDYKSFAKALKEKYNKIKCVIITLGGEGAYALDGNGEYFSPAKEVKVVSTVGAGDSFSAAFLHKYLMKDKVGDCLDFASVIAGYVVSVFDAVPEY